MRIKTDTYQFQYATLFWAINLLGLNDVREEDHPAPDLLGLTGFHEEQMVDLSYSSKL